MKEYETMKVYGKTLNTWTHMVTVDLGWKKYEEERTAQVELSYTEYNANGDKIGKGSEDFSVERLNSLKYYRIFTWDGEKRNKGGYKWFEEQRLVRINPTNRKHLKDLAAKWFPNAAEINIR